MLFRALSREDHCLTSSILSRACVSRCQPLSWLWKKTRYPPSESFSGREESSLLVRFSALPATSPLGNSRQGRRTGLSARVKRGRKRLSATPLPYEARGPGSSGTGCNHEDDEPPPGKRIYCRGKEEVAAKPRHTRTLCPSPQGESTLKGTAQGSHHPPASASLPQCLAAVPMHLLTCLSVLVGEGRGVPGGWVEGEGGQGDRGGCSEGSAPGASAQAQWPLPQAGGGNMAE